jgi:hypothetical protein
LLVLFFCPIIEQGSGFTCHPTLILVIGQNWGYRFSMLS